MNGSIRDGAELKGFGCVCQQSSHHAPRDVDAKPRYLGSNSNPDFIAEELPVGKTLEGQIVAVNAENEQGPASDAATVVVT
ncbi:MAG: hypothetical protein NT105_17800 [Verrucomicrobia bacterium]|nr:hypothetical protein [Verrucomicrobiota bacterium]